MVKMVINLGIKKGKNNDNSFPQLIHIQNSLLMSMADAYVKDSYVDGNSDIKKVRTYSVKLSSTFFLKRHAVYNRFNHAFKNALCCVHIFQGIVH